MKLNEREVATMMFALRFLQANLQDMRDDYGPNEPMSSHFERDDGTRIEEPDEEYLDELCFKINTAK